MVIHPMIIRKGGTEEEPTGVGHRVRFFDYDGTLLKTEFVEDGGDATLPAVPNPVPATDKNPALIHGFSWNNSIYDVRSDIDTGNMYNTVDKKTHIYLELNEDTGYTCDLLLNKTDTTLLNVDWGDSSALDTTSDSGNVSFNHTFPGAGKYIITFWLYPVAYGKLRLGQGSQATALFGEDKKFKAGVKRIFMSVNVGYIYTYGLADLINLEAISFPSSTMVIDAYAMSNCIRLKNVNLYGMTAIGGMCMNNCISLESITFPKTFTTVNNNLLFYVTKMKRLNFPYGLEIIKNSCFLYMKSIRQIIIPPSVTSIGTNAFGGMELVEWYKILPTVPPTITETTFNNCSAICRFYVPDESWEAYNNADYWKDLNLYKLSDFEEVE